MKSIIFSSILLSAFHLFVAESNDTGKALQFEEDAKNILQNITIRLRSEVDYFKRELLDLVDDLLAAFTSAQTSLGDKLNALGDEGKALNEDFQKVFSGLINSNTARVHQKLLNSKIGMKSIHLVIGNRYGIGRNKLQGDIKTVKNAINANKKSFKCWNDNENTVKAIPIKLFEDIHSDIEQWMNKLIADVKVVISTTAATTKTVEDELNSFGSDETSALNYIKYNYSSIVDDYTNQNQQSAILMSQVISAVLTIIRENVETARNIYQSNKDIIIQCIQEN